MKRGKSWALRCIPWCISASPVPVSAVGLFLLWCESLTSRNFNVFIKVFQSFSVFRFLFKGAGGSVLNFKTKQKKQSELWLQQPQLCLWVINEQRHMKSPLWDPPPWWHHHANTGEANTGEAWETPSRFNLQKHPAVSGNEASSVKISQWCRLSLEEEFQTSFLFSKNRIQRWKFHVFAAGKFQINCCFQKKLKQIMKTWGMI